MALPPPRSASRRNSHDGHWACSAETVVESSPAVPNKPLQATAKGGPRLSGTALCFYRQLVTTAEDLCRASGDTSNPASRGHLKSGQLVAGMVPVSFSL